MNLQIKDEYIPGTKLLREDMGNVTGMEFLQKVFYISNGVMLTQIRDVAGIDGSTLQNWTKRGWVENARLKKYNINQFAHILIINMLRSCMQLDKIAFLIQYINGRLDDTSDDIIEEAVLYDYICRILDSLMLSGSCSLASIRGEIRKVTADYNSPIPDANERLVNALEIIVVAYYAAIIKRRSDTLISHIVKED